MIKNSTLHKIDHSIHILGVYFSDFHRICKLKENQIFSKIDKHMTQKNTFPQCHNFEFSPVGIELKASWYHTKALLTLLNRHALDRRFLK